MTRRIEMGDTWRPFEPSRDAVDAARKEAAKNTCNRHDDCAAADRRARISGVRDAAYHCHSEDCEECFGC